MIFIKNRGVTLIELVISVAIISVLSSVITLKIKNYLLKAKDLKVEADLEILRAASNFYYIGENRALGDESINTGSGIPSGEVVEYTPYGESEFAHVVTYNHLQELIDKKYLERDILKKLSIIPGGTDGVKLDPGANVGAENCENGDFKSGSFSKTLTLIFNQDSVKISLWDGVWSISGNGEGNVDSTCKIWNMK